MQARAFRSNDEEDDDTDDDFSDDEDLQSPIDEVDPFVFFVDSTKGKYTSPDLINRILYVCNHGTYVV